MNDLEKRAKKHRKKQKGLPAFSSLNPMYILPDSGSDASISSFNKGTSLAESSDRNDICVGTKIEFYAPGRGLIYGTVKSIDGDKVQLKAANGKIYSKTLQELYDDFEFDSFGESWTADDAEIIKQIQKYWRGFNGTIRGKKCTSKQLYSLLDRLKSAEKAKEPEYDISDEPISHEVINDPKYNFDDPEREGIYTVESIYEKLEELESQSFKKNMCESYNLQDMYEEVQRQLTPQEKAELDKVIRSTNDADTIQNYISALRSKNEDFELESYENPEYQYIDDDMSWAGYELDEEIDDSSDTDEEDDSELLIKDDDDVEVAEVVKELTNNYTKTRGTLTTYYEDEKNEAVQQLKQHYDVVDVSDGRMDEDDEMNWVISYENSKSSSEIKKESYEDTWQDNLTRREMYFVVRADGDDLRRCDVWEDEDLEDSLYAAQQQAKDYLDNGDYDVVEVVFVEDGPHGKYEDVLLTYSIDDLQDEQEECLQEDLEFDGYTLMDIKHVPDSDGFLTDYTWWYSPEDDKHLFILGDADVYNPSTAESDWECDSEECAQEWWDSYEGVVDEDLNEGLFDSIEAMESKVLARNGADSLEEMDPQDMAREINAAKSLVAQAQKRNDKRSLEKFKKWLSILQRTADGEEFAVINDQEVYRVLNRIRGEIITNDMSEDEATDLINTLVGRKICDVETARKVLTSDQFLNMWNELFPRGTIKESLNEYEEIDMIVEALYDVSGIQEVSMSDNEAPDHYLIVFSNSGNADEREEALTNALISAGFDATCTAVNGSNVFEYHITRNVSEECEDSNMNEAAVLDTPPQEYTSSDTSINSSKLPAVYKLVDFNAGDVVVDYGGGKFDNAVNYLKDKDVTLVVYDPYNRSSEQNAQALEIIEANGGADGAINSNVLNVIKETEVRKSVLTNIKQLLKPGAPVYITVYEGSKDGVEGPTSKGYQLNRRLSDYLSEIQEVFPNAKRRGKLIIATK